MKKEGKYGAQDFAEFASQLLKADLAANGERIAESHCCEGRGSIIGKVQMLPNGRLGVRQDELALFSALGTHKCSFLYKYRGQVMKDLTVYLNGQYIISLLYWLYECSILGFK